MYRTFFKTFLQLSIEMEKINHMDFKILIFADVSKSVLQQNLRNLLKLKLAKIPMASTLKWTQHIADSGWLCILQHTVIHQFMFKTHFKNSFPYKLADRTLWQIERVGQLVTYLRKKLLICFLMNARNPRNFPYILWRTVLRKSRSRGSSLSKSSKS